MSTVQIADFTSLIVKFLANEISADQFQTLYLQEFKDWDGSVHAPKEVFDILNELFLDLEEYDVDEGLRDPDSLTEAQLRKKCGMALNSLQKLG